MRNVWMAALVVALGTSAAVAAPPEGGTADDEEAIRQVERQYVEAWNQADAKATAELFTPDADLIDPLGKVIRGREALEKEYAALYSGAFRGTRMALDVKTVRFLKPDVALLDGSWEISGVRGEGDREITLKGLYTNVLVKTNGRWLLAAGRVMAPVHPRPSESPAEPEAK